mgnify:CR=1 FL=1
MTLLETDRLILRNWGEEDRAFFHHINSDETIMEFFPYRRSREDADAAMDFIRDGIEQNGFGHDAADDFDHPAVPDTHPGLKRHVLYRLSRADWKARQA